MSETPLDAFVNRLITELNITPDDVWTAWESSEDGEGEPPPNLFCFLQPSDDLGQKIMAVVNDLSDPEVAELTYFNLFDLEAGIIDVRKINPPPDLRMVVWKLIVAKLQELVTV
jgi:hypothetical protein